MLDNMRMCVLCAQYRVTHVSECKLFAVLFLVTSLAIHPMRHTHTHTHHEASSDLVRRCGSCDIACAALRPHFRLSVNLVQIL